MKIGTRVRHVNGQCWERFQGHEVEVQGHSDAYGNLVNSIATETLKGFEQKLTQILTVVGRWTG